jgi:hypothetical protein
MGRAGKHSWRTRALGIAAIIVIALVVFDYVGGVWLLPDVRDKKNLGPPSKIVIGPYPKSTFDVYRTDSGWYYVPHAWFSLEPGQDLLLVTDNAGSSWLCRADMSRCARTVMHCQQEKHGQPTGCRAEPSGEFSLVFWYQRVLRPHLPWTPFLSPASRSHPAEQR